MTNKFSIYNWGFAAMLLLFASITYAQKVELIWSPSLDQTVTHYSIYRSIHQDSSFGLIGSLDCPDTVYYDMNFKSNNTYYYAVTACNNDGDESGFSNVVQVNTSSTPVEMNSFTAYSEKNATILEWSTLTENNNLGFEIERSFTNLMNFKKIGFVKGEGTTTHSQHYKYIDQNLEKGTYYYRLKQIDYSGEYEYSHIIEVSGGLPAEFRLYQNYPNPFNSSTLISYNLPKSGHVELTIHNINGQIIYKVVDEFQQQGHYTVHWNGKDYEGIKVSSGLYFYRIKSLDRVEFRRMVVQK